MGICGWIIFGFFAGLLARAVMPGPHQMGFIKTTLLGIVGSFVGGLLGAMISGRDPMVLQPSGFIGATLGAIVILAIGAWVSRPK